MSLPLILSEMRPIDTFMPTDTDVSSNEEQEDHNDEFVLRMRFIEKFQREPTNMELKDDHCRKLFT